MPPVMITTPSSPGLQHFPVGSYLFRGMQTISLISVSKRLFE